METQYKGNFNAGQHRDNKDAKEGQYVLIVIFQ